ncbi:DNA mismatch repair protein MutT [Aurantimonas sp. Leaf443]|nr:DNA mismatch repair protein MutT [Aurantimonas sp. Leaf443]
MDFTARDLRERLARAAGEALETEYGDHRLNAALVAHMERRALRAAAVLVPVVDRPQGAGIILTTRTASLRTHSGQIALPGGSIDPQDASPEAAALRESQEEIGLDPSYVEPIGRLPRYVTPSGFRIVPVVAIVSPGFTLVPNPAEVDDVFEVPLRFLMSPDNHRAEAREFQGVLRHYFTMPYETRHIWGVTAGILRTLYERLYA